MEHDDDKAFKYGVLTYNTKNLGDEIQTIAAMRFLPHIDYYFDRDHINDTKIAKDDKVKLIMNGWYMHNTNGWWLYDDKYQKFDWPPKNKNLIPLLISMYFERDNKDNLTDKAIISKESRTFFKKHGSIGARDIGTADFLNQNGIQSYFSGCLTLTLLPDTHIKKQNYILAVDISDTLYSQLQKTSKHKIIRLNTNRDHTLSFDDKIAIARYWLYLYQSAFCVVTTRLHAMLPCLAFETPVLAIRLKDTRRFKGLINLTNNTSEENFLNGKYQYDINNPPSNPEEWKTIAKQLAKTCSDFTNYDSKKSFMGDATNILEDPSLIEAIGLIAEKSDQYFFLDQHYQNIIKEYDSKISELNHLLSETNNPGIKTSLKNLKQAIYRRLNR
jgi:hypothetical protein